MTGDHEPDDLVDRALGRLDDPAGASWREAGEVKRTVTRRRHARFAVLGAAGLAVATAISLAVALPGSSTAPVPLAQLPSNGARIGAAMQLVANVKRQPVASGSADEQAVVKAEQAFTFALLKQVNAGGGTGNVVLSPSSLAIALAMLENGAGGRTKREIAKVLRTSGRTDAQLDSGWAALTADLSASGVLDSANSLWLQHGAPMGKAFMDAMARYFRTGVWQVDFTHDLGGAAKAINTWVSQQTHGKITKLFDKGDIDVTLLVLANAVYFKAAWQTEFDPKKTQNAQFHADSGGTVTVPFMTRSEDTPTLVSRTDGATAIELPYTGERFAALAIMPTTQPLADFVSGLTPAALDRITGGLRPGGQDVLLPKFTLARYTNLKGTLAAMGMPTAFGPAADLSPMDPRADYVQSVVQRAYLKVDEHGTEAAAVTGTGVTATSATMPLAFDHPFLFLVRDTRTGAILFSAQVQNPAS